MHRKATICIVRYLGKKKRKGSKGTKELRGTVLLEETNPGEEHNLLTSGN